MDSLFVYKFVLAAGADLERDDGEEESEVRQLWEKAIAFRPTNGTRHGAALRMANGMGMGFAPGVPGTWPMPSGDEGVVCA